MTSLVATVHVILRHTSVSAERTLLYSRLPYAGPVIDSAIDQVIVSSYDCMTYSDGTIIVVKS